MGARGAVFSDSAALLQATVGKSRTTTRTSRIRMEENAGRALFNSVDSCPIVLDFSSRG
jgi:hypothetical protein